MIRFNWLVIGVVALMLGGCGSPESAGDNKSAPKPEAAKEEGVFDPMVGTLDRADEVNDITDSRKDRLDEQIEGSN